jgi:hypothetical protein
VEVELLELLEYRAELLLEQMAQILQDFLLHLLVAEVELEKKLLR